MITYNSNDRSFSSCSVSMDYDVGFQSTFIDLTGTINPFLSPYVLWLRFGEAYALVLAHVSKIPWRCLIFFKRWVLSCALKVRHWEYQSAYPGPLIFLVPAAPYRRCRLLSVLPLYSTSLFICEVQHRNRMFQESEDVLESDLHLSVTKDNTVHNLRTGLIEHNPTLSDK